MSTTLPMASVLPCRTTAMPTRSCITTMQCNLSCHVHIIDQEKLPLMHRRILLSGVGVEVALVPEAIDSRKDGQPCIRIQD
jgi:hypothetical protein